jgi:prepilin signal peptidase PulO-like enzyme (type II secretory pathway)
MFGLIALQSVGLLSFFFYIFVFSILMVVAVYDIKHKIIPDSLSFSFGLLGFLFFVSQYHSDLLTFASITHFLAGPLLFLPFFLIWFLSDGRWMGLGDGKLAVGIGWLLGLSAGLSAVIIGIWIGAIWSIVIMILQKFKKTRTALTFKSEIPLAPFLILGTFIAFLAHPDIFNINMWIGVFFW